MNFFPSIEEFFNGMNSHLQPIPLEFSNALTTGKFLEEMYTYIKHIVENTDKLNEKIYDDFNKKFEELKDEFLNDDSYYLNTIQKVKEFCIQYMTVLIGDSLKYITFGLDENGYFCAYIPDTFDFLTFDTDVNVNSENYGKLKVIY